MTDIEFGKRFSELLTLRNITNTKLTELAGVSKNNIGNYKNGQIPNTTNISIRYLIVSNNKELCVVEKILNIFTPSFIIKANTIPIITLITFFHQDTLYSNGAYFSSNITANNKPIIIP